MTAFAPVELERTYDRRFAGLQAYRREVWSILTREFFQRFVPEQGAVLDLGCGWGEFINQIRAARKFGMDLNQSTRRHLDDAVVFLHQDCSAGWAVEDGALDTVFTSNFFEHLPDKASLGGTLKEAFRCLKPGGRLICLGPNIKYLPGAYWDFWDHYLPLTERSLTEGVELVGFRVERCLGRFLPYTMDTGFHPPLWTVSLYLQAPFLWRWFGKQFLLIAVKP
jgi:SAM-dependent methyltransferase